MHKLLMVLFLIIIGGDAPAQNFSCSYGKQAACLDYGDKVCTSYSKCVDQSAACFDTYQCDYEGFTCKSNVTECVEQHDSLVKKYNSLASDYDDLLVTAKEIVEENEVLAGKYNEQLQTARTLIQVLDDLKNCLVYASDLDEAQSCEGY